MLHYRCYFLDASRAIRDVAFIDCATVELAKDRARELLVERNFPFVELWLSDCLLYEAKNG